MHALDVDRDGPGRRRRARPPPPTPACRRCGSLAGELEASRAPPHWERDHRRRCRERAVQARGERAELRREADRAGGSPVGELVGEHLGVPLPAVDGMGHIAGHHRQHVAFALVGTVEHRHLVEAHLGEVGSDVDTSMGHRHRWRQPRDHHPFVDDDAHVAALPGGAGGQRPFGCGRQGHQVGRDAICDDRRLARCGREHEWIHRRRTGDVGRCAFRLHPVGDHGTIRASSGRVCAVESGDCRTGIDQ